MSFKTFAAIDVGSYELAMKIFEISKSNGIKEINSIRHRVELGLDSYLTGKISGERMDELCRLLREFVVIMKEYKVDAYKVYGTSAIRETKNTVIILDQIKTRTGLDISVLSNSEQRFLDYKSVALKGSDFMDIIEKGTAFIDIGGGSIQLSLFDKDSLVTTQNIRPGVLRMREELSKIPFKSYQLDEIVEEMVQDRLLSFKQMFVGKRKIENVIVVDEYVSLVLKKDLIAASKNGHIDIKSFDEFVTLLKERDPEEIAVRLGIPEENASLLYLSAITLRHMAHTLNAKFLWAPGVSLCDGIAYEYAEKNKLISLSHDFEKDILACAKDINFRYHSGERSTKSREEIALTIFDSMKSVHGLNKRARLLLQLAAILNECGRYISLNNVGENSYNIVMATEMIGLSHLERKIVANIVKYSTDTFEYYDTISRNSSLDKESFLTIAKLTAIIRLSDSLDISHREKCSNVKAALKDDTLTISVDSNSDLTLELSMFKRNSDLFEEVFNIKPVVKQKRTNL